MTWLILCALDVIFENKEICTLSQLNDGNEKRVHPSIGFELLYLEHWRWKMVPLGVHLGVHHRLSEQVLVWMGPELVGRSVEVEHLGYTL